MATPQKRSGGPSLPSGPPTGDPPPSNGINLTGIKRPTAPPPGVTNLTSLKPPPQAAPQNIDSTQSRPEIIGNKPKTSLSPEKLYESDSKSSSASTKTYKEGGIKMFEGEDPLLAQKKNNNTSPTSPSTTSSSTSTSQPKSPYSPLKVPLPRGAPPRGMPGFSQPIGPPPGYPDSNIQAPSGPPPGYTTNSNVTSPQGKITKPPPPQRPPPGIPEGQPGPPSSSPYQSKVPPPSHIPPLSQSGHRLPPPNFTPQEELLLRQQAGQSVNIADLVGPPKDPPPNKYIEKEVKRIRRRDKENFELLDSDSDEEKEAVEKAKQKFYDSKPSDKKSENDDDNYGPKFITQPKPFGVIKQEIPKTKYELEQDRIKLQLEEEQLKKMFANSEISLNSSRISIDNQSNITDTSKSKQNVIKLDENQTNNNNNNDNNENISSVNDNKQSVADILTNNNTIASSFLPSSSLLSDTNTGMNHFLRNLPKGRISIKIIEGENIRRKNDFDKIVSQNVSVRSTLGFGEKNEWKSTSILSKQGLNPKFNNEFSTSLNDEVLYFDIVDPYKLLYNNDIQLTFQVYHHHRQNETQIGFINMSILRFLKQPYVSYTEVLPLYYPQMNEYDSIDQLKSSMKLKVKIVFEEARVGILQVIVKELNDIRNIDDPNPFETKEKKNQHNSLTIPFQQDPYVELSLGKNYKKRTKSVKNTNGRNAVFRHQHHKYKVDTKSNTNNDNDDDINPDDDDYEGMLLWIDETNWVNDLMLKVLDEDHRDEKTIGETSISLLPYMRMIQASQAKEEIFDLFVQQKLPQGTNPKGNNIIQGEDGSIYREFTYGTVSLKICFYPAGKLNIHVDRARNLQFPLLSTNSAGATSYNPYVQLVLDGHSVQIVKRTPADRDGGKDPIFNSNVLLDIVDQYELQVQVLNQADLNYSGAQQNSRDQLIGFASVSLLSVFRNGDQQMWISLKQKKEGLGGEQQGMTEVGDVLVRFTFSGPVGVAYPQLRSHIDSYDDSLRKIKDDPKDQLIINRQKKEEEEKKKQIEAQKSLDNEFTEEEIRKAFSVLDLDHNNFLSAAEIRHILVCMGEMITDEEINMMITMIDLDGDGQISYDEFRTLVLHPNPGEADLHNEISNLLHEQSIRDVMHVRKNQKLHEQNNEKDDSFHNLQHQVITESSGNPLDLSSFQRQKEMLKREQKKKMLLNFIEDNEITFNTIKKAFTEIYLELPPNEKVNGRVNFTIFCKVMSIEPITEYKHLHSLFDDDESGFIDLRIFLLGLINFLEEFSDVYKHQPQHSQANHQLQLQHEERLKFSFYMYDERKSNFLSFSDIQAILSGNHMLPISSVTRKAETIMRQIGNSATLNNNVQNKTITLKELLVVSKKFPNIIFPTSGLIDKKKK